MGKIDVRPGTPPPVALVTGAGRGLGRAIAERFHAAGFVVMATDVNTPLFDDLHSSPRMLTAALDVTDAQSAKNVADILLNQCGRCDVVINNAGIIGYFPVSETDPETLIKHFQVNSFGALRVTHACLDLLIASGGRVLNITSESYKLRTPFQIYQPTKLALEGISDVLRRELCHLGVHVATLRPGAIATDLFFALEGISNPVENSRLEVPFENFANRLARSAPKKRATPQAVAEWVLRVATDQKKAPHYRINNMLSLSVMRLLPTRWADWLIAKMLR